MMKSLLLASAIGFSAGMVAANPYTEAVDTARVDNEALQQARKQLEHPPAEPRKAPLFVPSFHRRDVPEEAPAILCHRCHDRAPHRHSVRKRAFLNMHSHQITCETCHWRPKGMLLDYRRVRVPGAQMSEGLIAPLVEGKPVMTLAGEPWSRRLARNWEQADKEARAEIKARLHAPLEEKGPDCTACHDERKGMLDWRRLGYEAGRIQELQENPIARFLQRTEPESARDPVVRIELRDLLE